MYHSINVENASMSFVRTEGCLQAEVFLRVSDICAAEGEDGTQNVHRSG
jgi:hypothetical protein